MSELNNIDSDSSALSSASHTLEGSLQLVFRCGAPAKQTVMTVCKQQTPLKVVRAFALKDRGSLVHLHNVSGGVFGGDKLNLNADIGSDAKVQLTTTGATRLYRSRKSVAHAVQTNEIVIRENGLLEYLPDQLIPFAGSRYVQNTFIKLESNAGLFWWETVAPGREAHGELFEYDFLQLNLDIATDDKPLAIERIRLEPKLRPLMSQARLGPYRYFSSFYICRVGLEPNRWRELEERLGELVRQLSRPTKILWGVSTLSAHGLVVRALSVQGHDVGPGLLAFWRIAKRELYGQEVIVPRKVL